MKNIEKVEVYIKLKNEKAIATTIDKKEINLKSIEEQISNNNEFISFGFTGVKKELIDYYIITPSVVLD